MSVEDVESPAREGRSPGVDAYMRASAYVPGLGDLQVSAWRHVLSMSLLGGVDRRHCGISTYLDPTELPSSVELA
jgi:hypothetical protein